MVARKMSERFPVRWNLAEWNRREHDYGGCEVARGSGGMGWPLHVPFIEQLLRIGIDVGGVPERAARRVYRIEHLRYHVGASVITNH